MLIKNCHGIASISLPPLLLPLSIWGDGISTAASSSGGGAACGGGGGGASASTVICGRIERENQWVLGSRTSFISNSSDYRKGDGMS